MAFTSSQDIIDVVKKKIGLDDNLLTVFKIWEKELGPLARHLKLEAVKTGGKLIVQADSNVALQEGVLRRRELIKKLNQYFGSAKVIKGMQLKLKE